MNHVDLTASQQVVSYKTDLVYCQGANEILKAHSTPGFQTIPIILISCISLVLWYNVIDLQRM